MPDAEKAPAQFRGVFKRPVRILFNRAPLYFDANRPFMADLELRKLLESDPVLKRDVTWLKME